MKFDDTKILISDDSILARKQLKDILSQFGTPTFLEAANGQDAIDIYKKESPSLVFLDIVMPIKDGNAVIRCTDGIRINLHNNIIDDKIRQIEFAVGTQSQLREAIEAGASDFIQKPINADQIEHIITSRFEGR